MLYLTGARGTGKTYTLVKEANASFKEGNRVIVIVTKQDQETFLRQYGLDKGVEVISYSRYSKCPAVYSNSKIFLDELDSFLLKLFPYSTLEMASIDKERLVEISHPNPADTKTLLLDGAKLADIDSSKKRSRTFYVINLKNGKQLLCSNYYGHLSADEVRWDVRLEVVFPELCTCDISNEDIDDIQTYTGCYITAVETVEVK